MRAIRWLAFFLIAAVAGSLAAESPGLTSSGFSRPVHTYSIVAHDPLTGEFGVAVQSHWFQVGAIVSWARAGVGAVATQSFVEPAYGPRGLELMAQGKSAGEALDILLAADPQRDVRQIAMVDNQGRVAAWTGPKCIAAAGHQTGKSYSVQANLMDQDTVWPAMAAAFEAAEGSLAERLLAALEAAQAEGGDIRGQQSAALMVVRGEADVEPWRERLVDLRIADHPEPLVELRRLLRLHRAYEAMNGGDEAMARGDVVVASRLYSEGVETAPEVVELPFWQAVTLFTSGHEAEAVPILRRVFAAEERWRRLLPRLVPAGIVPDQAMIEKMLKAVDAPPPQSADG